MRAFTVRGDAAVANLDAHERAILRSVMADVAGLLGEDRADPPSPEPDPALGRLLPDAAPSDPEVSREFRELTEDNLRALKAERLETILNDLSGEGAEWAVPLEEGLATAAALTDVRLVLAERLGLRTDEDAELLRGELEMAQGLLTDGLPEGLGVDQERLWLVTVYQALSWLQDSLVACLMSEEGPDDE